jgi:hypothetical protein
VIFREFEGDALFGYAKSHAEVRFTPNSGCSAYATLGPRKANRYRGNLTSMSALARSGHELIPKHDAKGQKQT